MTPASPTRNRPRLDHQRERHEAVEMAVDEPVDDGAVRVDRRRRIEMGARKAATEVDAARPGTSGHEPVERGGRRRPAAPPTPAGRRCCEPTWNEKPTAQVVVTRRGRRGRRPRFRSSRTCATTASRRRPRRLPAGCTPCPRGRGAETLSSSAWASTVNRRTPSAGGLGDVALTLHRVAVGERRGRHTELGATADLARAGDIEPAAEPREKFDDLHGRVGLRRRRTRRPRAGPPAALGSARRRRRGRAGGTVSRRRRCRRGTLPGGQ